ncbi:hypothetical protein I79_019213 [Cricetulus griseus]|uniref:Uncharacterized protein n=1 Tax=Cricetulus griseus TaxID=10029 RepID=G3I6T5_CRIGR|nr:hypothetical protein I79_019213 [Cricetulus griseus]
MCTNVTNCDNAVETCDPGRESSEACPHKSGDRHGVGRVGTAQRGDGQAKDRLALGNMR